MLITINPDNPQMRLINRIADILKNGGLIAYPTDTYYGIGCDIMNKRSIERIYQLKQRSKNQPFSFICADLKNISRYAKVSNYAYKTMRRLLPGPYTFILAGSKLVPKIMLTKRKTAGIRVPANNICLDLVKALGNPRKPSALSALVGEGQEPLSEMIAEARAPLLAAADAPPDDRPPLPHMTIARIQRRAKGAERREALRWAEGLDRLFHHVPVRLFLAGITRDQQGVAPEPIHVLRDDLRALPRLFVHGMRTIVQDDVRTEGGKLERDAPAHTVGCPAGDECCLSLEIHGVLPSRRDYR